MATEASDADNNLVRLGGALRAVQDRVANTKAPSSAADEATGLLEQAAALLDPYKYDPDADRSWDDIGRATGTAPSAPFRPT